MEILLWRLASRGRNARAGTVPLGARACGAPQAQQVGERSAAPYDVRVTHPPVEYLRRWRTDGAALLVGALAAAAAVVLAAGGVSAVEEWVFRLINDLPNALDRPMWAGQLVGLLYVPLALTVTALLLRRWRLALAAALLVPLKLFVEDRIMKAVADRERPTAAICGGDTDCLNVRGAHAAGVFMPSGHAVIAPGIWWLIAPYLDRRWQWAALGAAILNPLAGVRQHAAAPPERSPDVQPA